MDISEQAVLPLLAANSWLRLEAYAMYVLRTCIGAVYLEVCQPKLCLDCHVK